MNWKPTNPPEKLPGGNEGHLEASNPPARSSSGSFQAAHLPFTKPSFIEFVGRSLADLRTADVLKASVDYAATYIRPCSSLALIGSRNNPADYDVAGASDAELESLVGLRLAGAADLLQQLSQAGEALSAPDLASWGGASPWADLFEKMAALGFASLIMVPVKTFGALIIAGKETFAFSHYDEAMLSSLAAQTAFIMEGMTALAAAGNSAKLSEEILDISAKLAANLDIATVLDELLREVALLVGADAASLMLVDKSTGRLDVRSGLGISAEGLAASIAVGEGISGWVAKTGKPIIISDASGLGPELPDTSLKRTLSLPIKLGDEVVGVVNLGKKGPGADFDRDAVRSAAGLLAKAAVALENAQAAAAMRDLYIETIKAFTQVIETKDPFSRGHSENVTKYALAIAERMELGEEESETLRIAAMMHDVGYAGVSEAIFRGPRPLTSVERVLVNTHPVVASEVLKKVPLLSGVVPLILHHHENYDGSGYIAGLKGEDIPLGARILAVADAFDAMTSERSYRQAMTRSEAVAELRRNAGKQFDPEVVHLFCEYLEERNEKPERKIDGTAPVSTD